MPVRDLLYIPKQDRYAIIVLLILILTSITVYIFTAPQAVNTDDNSFSKNPEMEAFIKNMRDIAKLKEGEFIYLNTADTTELMRIPGIGPSYAQRIVERREAIGRFSSIEQLKDIKGIGQKFYTKIVPYIRLDEDNVKTLN